MKNSEGAAVSLSRPRTGTRREIEREIREAIDQRLDIALPAWLRYTIDVELKDQSFDRHLRLIVRLETRWQRWWRKFTDWIGTSGF
jgi:hypothetical protein